MDPMTVYTAGKTAYTIGKTTAGLFGHKPKISEGDPSYPKLPNSNNHVNVLMGFDEEVYRNVGFSQYLKMAKAQISTDWMLISEYSRVYGVSNADNPLGFVPGSEYDPGATYKMNGYLIKNGKFYNETTAQVSPNFTQIPYTTALPDNTRVHTPAVPETQINMTGNTKYVLAGAGLLLILGIGLRRL